MSKPDAWMPLWIGDYLKDTSRLSLAEHGAYLKLLMDAWVNGPPADDDRELCRILGCQPAEWRKIRQKIAGFFTISGGFWRHKRLEAEKAGAEERSGRAATKARLAAKARWDRETGGEKGAQSPPETMPQAMPQAMLEDVHMQCPSPVTYSVPTEQAETPDKRAWREATNLLTTVGGMKEPGARAFFGKLLRDNKLEAHQLLTAVVAASLKTDDPRPYLTAAAKGLARRIGGQGNAPAAVNVDGWTPDIWASAYRAFRERGAWDEAVMGPEPGKPGCKVPPAVMLEAAA